MTAFFAYHNFAAGDHKAARDKYLPLGYKYTSLSVYGPPQNPLYAGVLVGGFAPNSQVEVHGLNATQWQKAFNDQTTVGRGPIIAVATGPFGSATYAAVFEKMNAIPYTKTGISRSDFDTLNQQAQAAPDPGNPIPNCILSWAGSFGTAADPRYIGIWPANPTRIVWNVSRLNPADDQQWFDASVYQWVRQVFSVYSPELDEYISIYRDDAPTVGQAESAMTADQYQQTFNDLTAKGFIPSCVQGSGSNTILITPTFVNPTSSGKRIWSAPSGPKPHGALSNFDGYMQTFMQKNRVHAGAVAVVKGTRLVVARGYTYGEAGYPVTQPQSIFRVASCSKLITAVAILQLVDKGLLHLGDKIVNKLPFSISSSLQGFSHIAKITVDDLLCMISGYDGSIMSEFAVAQHLGISSFPITKQQRARAMMETQFLSGDPGTSEHYCNLGYSLLALVLENVTQKSYAAYVKTNIFGLFNASRAQIDVSATNAQPSGAVVQHDRYAGNSRSVLSGPVNGGRPIVPTVYGGTDYSTYDAYGGWCMAAVDFAAFLATMNRSPCPYFTKATTLPLLSTQNVAYQTTLSGQKLEEPGWARGWSLDKSAPVTVRWWGGTLNDIGCYFSLDDNQIGIVAFMNTDMNRIDFSYWAGLRNVATAITDWGADNFFSQYGLTIP